MFHSSVSIIPRITVHEKQTGCLYGFPVCLFILRIIQSDDALIPLMLFIFVELVDLFHLFVAQLKPE